MRQDNVDLKYAFDSLNEEISRLKQLQDSESDWRLHSEPLKPIHSLAEISDDEGVFNYDGLPHLHANSSNLMEDQPQYEFRN